jgi:hypothetical protein
MNRVDDAQRSRCCAHISTRPSRGARPRSEASKLLAMTWIEADEGLQAQATTKVTCCRAQQRSRSISALSAGCSTLRPRQYLVLYPSGYWAPIFVIGLDKRARTVRKPSNFPPSGQFSIIIEPGRVSRLGLRPHPRPEHGLDSTRVADLSGGMGRGVGHRLVMGSEPEQWRRRGGLVGLGRWRECLDHSDGSHGANDDRARGWTLFRAKAPA